MLQRNWRARQNRNSLVRLRQGIHYPGHGSLRENNHVGLGRQFPQPANDHCVVPGGVSAHQRIERALAQPGRKRDFFFAIAARRWIKSAVGDNVLGRVAIMPMREPV